MSAHNNSKLLAVDIGGTKTIISEAQKDESGIKLKNIEKYITKEYKSFAQILNLYLSQQKISPESYHISIGAAGSLNRNKLTFSNIPWSFNVKTLVQKFSFQSCSVKNDVQSMLHAIPYLSANSIKNISNRPVRKNSVVSLLAIGTGLGESFGTLVDGKIVSAFGTEGGHAYFSPTNQMEWKLWNYVYQIKKSVLYEDLLSGRGIRLIYDFVINTIQKESKYMQDFLKKNQNDQQAIIFMAHENKDKASIITMEIFTSILAGECRNWSLKTLPYSGLYLAGGVIAKSAFYLIKNKANILNSYFTDKKLFEIVKDIPLKIITDELCCIKGAAAFFYENI